MLSLGSCSRIYFKAHFVLRAVALPAKMLTPIAKTATAPLRWPRYLKKRRFPLVAFCILATK